MYKSLGYLLIITGVILIGILELSTQIIWKIEEIYVNLHKKG